jgi:hypothetical protein
MVSLRGMSDSPSELRSNACRNTVSGMQDLERPLRLPRVDRWLARRGGGLPVLTNDGAVLLDRRLRVRRRAGAIGCAVGAPALAAVGAGATSAGRSALDWWAIGLVLLAVAVLTWSVLVRVGERRLAAGLTRRVSRDSAAPVWRQVGLLRSLNCVIVVLAGLAFLAALIALHAKVALIALFAGLFVVVATLCGVALWQLVHAPAVAVDEGSLAVDQRLRRREVYVAVLPLFAAVFSIGAEIDLFGPDARWRLDRLVEWSWVFYLAVVVIEGIASELEKDDSSPPPRRRTWKPWKPSA